MGAGGRAGHWAQARVAGVRTGSQGVLALGVGAGARALQRRAGAGAAGTGARGRRRQGRPGRPPGRVAGPGWVFWCT